MVVLSHDAFNEVETWRSVIVVPLTTSGRQQLRGPTVAALPAPVTGLPKNSSALGHQITTLDRAKLTERIGRLDEEHLHAVEQAVLRACGIDTPLRADAPAVR